MKKIILFLSLLSILSTPIPTWAVEVTFPDNKIYTYGQFDDVSESSWYGADNQGVIKQMYEKGIMNGMDKHLFSPEGNMRISEAIKIAALIHDIYTKSNYNFEATEPWYTSYVDYALKYGILKNGDFSDYTSYATHAEMAHIFVNAVDENQLTVKNTVNGVRDVPFENNYREDILTLYRAGIVSGSDEFHSFYPDSPITRAEAAAIISRIIDKNNRMSLEVIDTQGDVKLHNEFGIYNEHGFRLSVGYQSKNNLDAFIEGYAEHLTSETIAYGNDFSRNTSLVNLSVNLKDDMDYVITYLQSDFSDNIYIMEISTFNDTQYTDRDIHIGDTEKKLLEAYPLNDNTYSAVKLDSLELNTYTYVYDVTNACSISFNIKDGIIQKIHLSETFYGDR